MICGFDTLNTYVNEYIFIIHPNYIDLVSASAIDGCGNTSQLKALHALTV